jgi:hypothetical protein
MRLALDGAEAAEMAKAKFVIGENEKHTIIVNASALLKYISIEVDGKKVINETHLTPAAKKFQLEVGDTEKHQVDIEAGPFSAAKVTVDGKDTQKT